MYSDKKGLVKTFVIIVIGVVFLSYVGFDLRSQVLEFQTENSDSISAVSGFVFDILIPRSAELIQETQEFSEQGGFDPVKRLAELFASFFKGIE